MMKDWSADKIIAVGMMAALLLTILGADIVSVMKGDMEIASLGKEIIIGLFGYMGRGAVQMMQNSQPGKAVETLEKVAATATEAQKAVQAAEAIKDIVKK